MLVKKPHYGRWKDMIQRCYNHNRPGFANYGGRGIRVCREWRKFSVFQAWCLRTFEPGKSIDRKNNDGNYSPRNCRWATASEQVLNSRHDTPGRLRATKNRLRLSRERNLRIYGDPNTRKRRYCPKCTSFKGQKYFYPGRLTGGYCKPCFRKISLARYYARKPR